MANSAAWRRGVHDTLSPSAEKMSELPMAAVLRPAFVKDCPRAPGIDGSEVVGPASSPESENVGTAKPAKLNSWDKPINSATAPVGDSPVNVSYSRAAGAPPYTSSDMSVKPVSEPARLLAPAPMVTWAAGDVCGPAARVLMRPMAPWEATARKWVQRCAVKSSTDS